MWHAPVTTTAPAQEPITLALAKEFLRLEGNDRFDGEVGLHIAGARTAIETRTSTRLITQQVRIACDRIADLDRLPIGPVAAIVEIVFIAPDGTRDEVPGEAFELFGSGLTFGIRTTDGSAWPAPASRSGAIEVTLTVGYGADGDALPGDLKLALLFAIRAGFDDAPHVIDHWLCNHRIWP